MSVITFPDSLGITQQSWGQVRMAIRFSSPFGSQAIEAGHPLWRTTIGRSQIISSSDEADAWTSLMLSMRGGLNQLAMWNKGRPVPRGTLRGSLQLAADVAQGATTANISGGAAGGTLLAGDFLGIGDGLTQQVVMVVAPATADGDGNITATFEPPLRNAFAAGTEMRWNKPKALFRMQEDAIGWDYEHVIINGFQIELLEDWRP